jgi:hypothetical protein
MADQGISLQLTDQPSREDVAFLDGQINAFNMAAFARHPQRGVVAGISGYSWARFCELQLLWVHVHLRGQAPSLSGQSPSARRSSREA